MSRRRQLFLVVAAAVLLALIAILVSLCRPKDAGAPPEGTQTGSGASPTVVATAVANVCRPNPSPAQANLQPTDFGFRQLDSPRSGDAARSPLRVSGRANPFEGAYSVTVFDASGNQIVSRN